MDTAHKIMADLDPGLDEFREVLWAAFDQVAEGKGEERHGQGAPFRDQPWRTIGRAAPGFLAGQAAKKAMEAEAMRGTAGFTGERYEREMLGVITYAAMAVMLQREADARAVEAQERGAMLREAMGGVVEHLYGLDEQQQAEGALAVQGV